MKLSVAEQQKVLESLSFLKERKCDLCGSSELLLNDRIFELREFQGGSLVLGGESAVFPVIAVSCRKCGNTYFFNAILLGILDKKDEPK